MAETCKLPDALATLEAGAVDFDKESLAQVREGLEAGCKLYAEGGYSAAYTRYYRAKADLMLAETNSVELRKKAQLVDAVVYFADTKMAEVQELGAAVTRKRLLIGTGVGLLVLGFFWYQARKAKGDTDVEP